MKDLIERQAAIDEANAWLFECLGVHKQNRSCGLIRRLEDLPSAQPEPFTYKEQIIFLAAMCREEKVCKKVDEECRDGRVPYEDSLVKVCREIMRKVKGALWT